MYAHCIEANGVLGVVPGSSVGHGCSDCSLKLLQEEEAASACGGPGAAACCRPA